MVRNRLFYVMTADTSLVMKMIKFAKQNYTEIKNFQESAALVRMSQENIPSLVVLDWDHRELESFKVLNDWNQNADLRRVPVVGFVAEQKGFRREEVEKLGCDRVYSKTQFVASLEDIFLRYAI